ncbi:uncharacterized protein SPSK_01262 [Sporothrix schenckii 1099-18]|uniref:Histidinolphosphatase-like protein n=1 Tax=Sporothrix schenckii 1099-18 TaxID=1397361 RepID=A0A0F2LXR5_SPOSC|nr:uncharacterized protein SPSK_01262 [Sporothrix schenckii 1099-18]KJR81285.1 hypothetical protein SPSK_01262 [Sporothrix schenckii 1099-18]
MASTEPTSASAPATTPLAVPAAVPGSTPATPAAAAIILRTPSKYITSSSPASPSAFKAPPAEWLVRTWSVTHSTLSMWRSAQNVRISYRLLPDDASGRPRNEDRVEYESNKGTGPKKIKSVEGTNLMGTDGTFDWRGKSWLFFVTSHWEILGWGERPVAGGAPGEVERWVVTWFAPTLFTKEGIDFYSDRREGLSAETAAALQTAIATTAQWPAPLATLAKDLLPVDINLPWAE